MKRITASILMIFAIALTACGTSPTSTSTISKNSSNTALTELQLAVGILKLESTEKEVTAEQAPELLMIWQVYADLSQSDTAAQEEIDALAEQVQETLTADQIQAIRDMQITQQDAAALTQGSTVTSVSQTSSNTTTQAAGMPAGGPPDGGGIPSDFGGGAGATTSTNKTSNAQTNSSLKSSVGVPSALVEILIQALQKKITS